MRGTMRAGISGVSLALIAGTASAQMAGGQMGGTPGAGYPPPGPGMTYPAMPPAPHAPVGAPQPWGSTVGGQWSGGVNAPGGVEAYRQPYRGYRVPSYWVSPRFHVVDYNYYGLPQPLGGYGWTRYYDDAVMIDRGGQVYDYRSGIDWDGRYDEHRSSGIGGAVAGAVVGGVAGNLIAGRGDRLGGTLIGAGVGGAAGYAIDRSQVRRGQPPRVDGGGYRGTYQDGQRPRYDRGERYESGRDGAGYSAGPSSWVSADGRTTVTTTSGGYAGGYGGGYAGSYEGGYPVVSAPYGYASGGSYTTVTVQSAPVVTTTTTEIIEDSVTYSRPVIHRVYRHRVYRARPRVRVRCGCGS